MPYVEEIIKKAMDAPHTVSEGEIIYLERFAEKFLNFLETCEPRLDLEPAPEIVDLTEMELEAVRIALAHVPLHLLCDGMGITPFRACDLTMKIRDKLG